MAIDITMPALSPTMESGVLAKWHVKPGDEVNPGDVIAEIETDKATMEVEAVDSGTVSEILVAEGTQDVKVNAVIARLTGEGEDETPAPARTPEPAKEQEAEPKKETAAQAPAQDAQKPAPQPVSAGKGGAANGQAASAPGSRVKASPLARRIALELKVDLGAITGSGPNGRIVRADVEKATSQGAAQRPAAEAPAPAAPAAAAAPTSAALPGTDVPHEDVKVTSMRRTIARRLTESKQTVPHYYLTVDIKLDALLKMRGELNASLADQGVKLSVNDMLVKALGLALLKIPDANVSFGGDIIRRFSRADVSVAVAIPGGLITPVIRDAANKRLSAIGTETKELAGRAREGKLQPHEYTGGTASISNLGMYGIRQFEAVINPPEGLIIAVGAGEKRPWVIDGALGIATIMSATGSFDHRAIDGAVGAELMEAFRSFIENPLTMLA